MNAPTLWIIFPIALGFLLLFFNNQRILSLLGGSVAVALALIAQFVPIEEALKVGSFSLRIDSALNILGRSLVLPATAGPRRAPRKRAGPRSWSGRARR